VWLRAVDARSDSFTAPQSLLALVGKVAVLRGSGVPPHSVAENAGRGEGLGEGCGDGVLGVVAVMCGAVTFTGTFS